MKATIKLEDWRILTWEFIEESQRRTPDDKKEYWCIDSMCSIRTSEAEWDNTDIARFRSWNFFNTREEAEMDLLRTQAFRVKGTANKEEGLFYYAWSFWHNRVETFSSWNSALPKFKTSTEAQEWWEKYAKAFTYNQ